MELASPLHASLSLSLELFPPIFPSHFPLPLRRIRLPPAPAHTSILHLHFPTTRSLRTTLALAPHCLPLHRFCHCLPLRRFCLHLPSPSLPRSPAPLRPSLCYTDAPSTRSFRKKLPPNLGCLSLSGQNRRSQTVSLSRSAPAVSLSPPTCLRGEASSLSFLTKLPPSPGRLSLSPKFSLHFASPLPAKINFPFLVLPLAPATTTIFHSLSLPDISVGLSLFPSLSRRPAFNEKLLHEASTNPSYLPLPLFFRPFSLFLSGADASLPPSPSCFVGPLMSPFPSHFPSSTPATRYTIRYCTAAQPQVKTSEKEISFADH